MAPYEDSPERSVDASSFAATVEYSASALRLDFFGFATAESADALTQPRGSALMAARIKRRRPRAKSPSSTPLSGAEYLRRAERRLANVEFRRAWALRPCATSNREKSAARCSVRATAAFGANQVRTAPSALRVATRARRFRTPHADRPKAPSSTATPTKRPPVRAHEMTCSSFGAESASSKTCQNRAVPSCDAVTKKAPSRDAATPTTALAWPTSSTRLAFEGAGSGSRTGAALRPFWKRQATGGPTSPPA
mmetsp:Transcript_8057/g.28613  ORF Transcript_8057/g.28613 Transcript_8057/m.28613 type:complete len:252 (+) Transcript_8057:1228-1983(+)